MQQVTVQYKSERFSLVASLRVAECRWEQKENRFYMTHGVIDGYQSLPLTPPQTPISVEATPELLTITVPAAEDVAQVAAFLKDADDYCQASFSKMRI